MSAADLSPDQRRERGTRLCARLAEDVASIAPPGIGHWPKTWDIVADADARFLAALTGWEADPTPATLDQTRGAYRALVDAWREAARQYTAAHPDRTAR